MRDIFVHQADLVLEPGADPQAPGPAITVALCGHWAHAEPCRWPHHTSAEPTAHAAVPGTSLTVRTVFASPAEEEPALRDRIVGALRAGELDGPTGPSRWGLRQHAAVDLAADERDLGDRLRGA